MSEARNTERNEEETRTAKKSAQSAERSTQPMAPKTFSLNLPECNALRAVCMMWAAAFSPEAAEPEDLARYESIVNLAGRLGQFVNKNWPEASREDRREDKAEHRKTA